MPFSIALNLLREYPIDILGTMVKSLKKPFIWFSCGATATFMLPRRLRVETMPKRALFQPEKYSRDKTLFYEILERLQQ